MLGDLRFKSLQKINKTHSIQVLRCKGICVWLDAIVLSNYNSNRQQLHMKTPIIDLFAGPGGLGEGFSSFHCTDKKKSAFNIVLSIEKDFDASETLLLRSFLRKFIEVPENYYSYLKGEITKQELFQHHKKEAEAAQKEVWQAELGVINEKEVDKRIESGLNGAKTWVLIGGPPCQAYSLAGRSRMRSADPKKFEQDERHFLYREYLRIVRKHKPSVFVMENVKGILSSKVNGELIFTKILKDLERKTHNNPGYHICSFTKSGSKEELEPNDFIIRSEQYGIPQARHRVILLGIRKDLPNEHELITKAEYIPTVLDAIGDLPKLRSTLSREPDTYETWKSYISTRPPVPTEIDKRVWIDKTDENLRNAIHKNSGNDRFIKRLHPKKMSPWLKNKSDWFYDDNLKGVLNHRSRGHINADIQRYFFASNFAQQTGRSPRLQEYPKALLPKHKNIKQKKIIFNDRFRVQIGNKYATTIVSHISKDGHYYIHPDPSQCRSLTVREAARLQTFPDNYFFESARTAQFKQVGNAVPPLLAHQLAKVVWKIIEKL